MSETIVKGEKLKKWFLLKTGFFRTLISKETLAVHAVDGVDIEVKRGEILGLVGESGSGKTTTGRLLLRLIEPTDGKIFFRDMEITHLDDNQMRALRRKMQIVFQDPYSSLNPRMTVGDIVAEPVRILEQKTPQQVEDLVKKTLEDVELHPADEFFFRYPHELSGGQRQRVAVARAFVLNPEFVVADEPVSMLDVSIRAEILDLMLQLKEKHKTAFLYITHDLALARHLCDKITVMYLGKIMEKGDSDQVISEALHPYTLALLAAVPVPDPSVQRSESVLKGEIPSPVNPPSGCRFHTRCPSYIGDVCRQKEPPLTDIGSGHYVSCHLYPKKE
jgi:oligopeptide/dipeptide ABC transporter ATP-binding protein